MSAVKMRHACGEEKLSRILKIASTLPLGGKENYVTPQKDGKVLLDIIAGIYAVMMDKEPKTMIYVSDYEIRENVDTWFNLDRVVPVPEIIKSHFFMATARLEEVLTVMNDDGLNISEMVDALEKIGL